MAFRIEEEIATLRVESMAISKMETTTRMTSREYIEAAMRTKNNEFSKKELIIEAALGLAGELGEYAVTINKKGRKDELGDVQWYIASMCDACKIDFEKISNYNTEYVEEKDKRMLLTLSASICDYIKKVYFQGHILEDFRLESRLIRLQSMIMKVCKTEGFNIQEIWQLNINKLRERYPNGFDVDKSVNREAE